MSIYKINYFEPDTTTSSIIITNTKCGYLINKRTKKAKNPIMLGYIDYLKNYNTLICLIDCITDVGIIVVLPMLSIKCGLSLFSI